MIGPLHVTNGDIVADALAATSLPGRTLVWADVLHAGPLEAEPARSRKARAAFLARHGWGEAASLEARFERRDARLDEARWDGLPIVLWFEHDLFDQLLLLQLLTALSGAQPGQVELIQAATHLGSLEPSELEALWPTRQPVAAGTLAEAAAIWDAVCAGELEAASGVRCDALPYVEPALERLREERLEPSRTKRQLLAAFAAGQATASAAYVASQAEEDAAFLGDAWAFVAIEELVDDGLVEPTDGAAPPACDTETFASRIFTLTSRGLARV